MCWNGRSQTRQSLRPAEAFGTYLGPQGDYKSNQSRMSAGRTGWGRRKLVLTSENIVCFPKAFPFPSGQEELSFGAWEADHGGTGRPRGGSGTPGHISEVFAYHVYFLREVPVLHYSSFSLQASLGLLRSPGTPPGNSMGLRSLKFVHSEETIISKGPTTCQDSCLQECGLSHIHKC